MEPLVSVVTVVRNLIKSGREETFRQSVESVHNQSYPHVEHLVIDGASTDGTKEVIAEYAEKGWIKVLSEADSGIYDAMNKGVRLAGGRYVAFLNSDDYYVDSDVVRRTVDALTKSGAAFSFSAAIVERLGKRPTQFRPRLGRMLTHMPFAHPTMFVDRDVLLAYGGFDVRFRIAADFHLVQRLILGGERGVKVPGPLVCFRNGGVSSISKAQMTNEIADILYSNFHTSVNCTREECLVFAERRYIPGRLVGKIVLQCQRLNQYSIAVQNFLCRMKWFRRALERKTWRKR